MKPSKKYFFGWDNWKFLIVELIKIGSNKPSYFSQKRMHEGAAMAILQAGMIFWLLIKYVDMETSDFTVWCGVELLICGYQRNIIQKQKLTDKLLKDENNSDESASKH